MKLKQKQKIVADLKEIQATILKENENFSARCEHWDIFGHESASNLAGQAEKLTDIINLLSKEIQGATKPRTEKGICKDCGGKLFECEWAINVFATHNGLDIDQVKRDMIGLSCDSCGDSWAESKKNAKIP